MSILVVCKTMTRVQVRAWAYLLFNSCHNPCVALCHSVLSRQYLGTVQETAQPVSCGQFGYFHPGVLWRETRPSVWSQAMPCHRGQGHRTVFVHFYSSDTARESAAEAQGKWQQRTTVEYQPTGRKFCEASPRETLSILAQPQLYLKGTLLESVGQDERNNEAWFKCWE